MAKRPIEIDCEEVWRHISDYLEGAVDADLRAMLASHFRDCAHCTAVLDGTRNVVRLVGDGKAFDIPAGSGRNLFRKLNQHLAARPRTRRKQ